MSEKFFKARTGQIRLIQLERQLTEANERIKRLEEAVQERDKEWFQVIESILGFHPVSMTEALRIGIERIKKQNQRIKRLEERIHRAAVAFFRDGSDGQVASGMLAILEEERGKP